MLWFQLSPNTVRSRVEQGPSGRSAIWRRRRSSSPLRAEIGISVYRPTSIPTQCLCCSPETLLSYRHCHSLVLRSPQVLPTWCVVFREAKYSSFAPVTNVSCVAEQPQLALDRRSHGLFCLY